MIPALLAAAALSSGARTLPPAAPPPASPALAELKAIAAELGAPAPAPAAAPAPKLHKASGRPGDEPTGSLFVRLYDARRMPLTLGKQKILLRVLDGRRRELVSRYVTGPEIRVTGLPAPDNADADYSVIAFAKGWKSGGFFPVRVSEGWTKTIDVMLVPKKGRFDFSRSTWEHLPKSAPGIFGLLAPKEPIERSRYEMLMAEKPELAAALLNIAKASSMISVGGRSALSHYKELVWDDLSRSYAFVWVEERLLDIMRKDKVRFKRELAPWIFHPGATISFKQIEFGEGNVQFTFNENRRKVVDGVPLVMMESDMDLYRDPAAHFLLEVAPALGQRGTTDPLDILQVRWMAGRAAGAPEFDPLYDFVAD